MRSDPYFTGNYLFHLHTTYTDGLLSVREYFEHAKLHSIDRLIFLEHIRREPSYDVRAFIREITEHAHEFNLAATVGFEAKLLPDGELDISRRDLERAAVLGIAEHSFPDSLETLQSAFKKAVDACSRVRPDLTVVWVHPGWWFKRRGLLPALEHEYASLIVHAVEHGVWIERNIRYGLAPPSLLSRIPVARVVTGLDAHSISHLQHYFEPAEEVRA